MSKVNWLIYKVANYINKVRDFMSKLRAIACCFQRTECKIAG